MNLRRAVTLLITLSFSPLIVFSQNSKQELNDQFWEAVRRGDATAVTTLLDKGADVNAKFRYGTTALFKAAERGNVEIVKILLARGADVTVRDTFYGATAMTWAVDGGHLDVIRTLLDKQPGSVAEVVRAGVGSQRPEVIKVGLEKGGSTKESLTAALAFASFIKAKPEIGELLKSGGAVPPPQIDVVRLQSYTGKYKAEAGMEITVTLSDGFLMGTRSGQRPQPMFPVDDSTFKAIFADDVMVRFKVEDAKVTGFTLTEGPKTTELTRVVETKQP